MPNTNFGDVSRVPISASRLKARLLNALRLDAFELPGTEEQQAVVVSAAFLKIIVACIVTNVALVGAFGHNRGTALFAVSVLGIGALLAALRLVVTGHVWIGTWLGTFTPIAVGVFASWYAASLGVVQVLWAVVGIVYCTFVFGLRAGSLASGMALGAFALVGLAAASGTLEARMSPHPVNQWLGLFTPTLVLLLATGLIRDALLKSKRLHLESSALHTREQEERLRASKSAADFLEQEVRRRTTSLEHAVKDLRTLNYLLSHDLSGGLSAIRSFAGVLRESEGERLSRDGLRRLARVEQNARDLQGMIDGLLTYVRVSTLEPTPGCVDAAAIMTAVAESLQAEYPQIAITWSGGFVWADATMLRHILQNLVGNACKHAGSRPDPHVHVGVAHHDAEAVISVKDNGPGFDPTEAERIFDIFQRGSGTPSTAQGHGVGLAVVKHLTEKLGGRAWAESSGDGARFFIALPCAPSAASA